MACHQRDNVDDYLGETAPYGLVNTPYTTAREDAGVAVGAVPFSLPVRDCQADDQ